MTKAKLTRIPKRVLACVLAVLMVLSCLTMLPFTGFAASLAHAQLESPAVVQDGSKYYAFGSGNVLYESSDMADWDKADPYISADGVRNIVTTYEGRLGETITEADLSSPEVVEINGTWYLYISAMSGSTSMILRAASASGAAVGPYTSFDPIMETGFERRAADDVLQGYIQDAYGDSDIPDLVSEWGKGTCYYYSNFLGLNYQWYTEELPRAYAPSIAQDNKGNYWMAYGYRDGGIWMQKIDPATGLVDYTWSGNNYAALGGWQTSPYQYVPEEDYNTSSVGEARLDPYFGELLVHTTEGGDTDTLLSSVSRAGEEPELYFADGTAYLQVTYGGADNSDGYNVRSYKNDSGYAPAGTTDTWNFVDMLGTSAVANADSSMIKATINDEPVDRTGLKLMGDYNMPGTNSQQYYTSSGASSVSSNDSGMLFYNYQTRFNKTLDGSTVTAPDSDQPLTEMRSHILLHNVDGDPLVTPFEYTAADEGLYEAAYGENAQQYDIDNDIVGQYYVTMSGNETSTSMANTGGVTLTAGGLVMGAISGSWAFEERRDGSNTNYIVITDDVNHVEYHGALLKQTVEDPTSLKGLTETMTFTAVGNNQTIWGVWYENYEPSGENNANAHLSVSPAIYTGGALALNAVTNGQLGLKYGNYITAFSFANIDYSTYLTIDSQYEITNVYDDNDTADSVDGDGINGIEFYQVTQSLLDGDFANSDLVQSVYGNRSVDDEERHSTTGADTGSTGEYRGSNAESINNLKAGLQAKLDELDEDQSLYVLSGYLDSTFYGRDAVDDGVNIGKTNDKGDIVLRVEYKDVNNTNAPDNQFNERLYTHVYQQPVSANVSGAVYAANYTWGSSLYYRYTNTAYMRAEGSYASDSYFPGTEEITDNIRNSTIRDSEGSKKFASKGLYLWYNPTLFTDSPQYYPGDNDWFHGEHTSILANGNSDATSFNGGTYINDGGYRSNASAIDIATSYETTINQTAENNAYQAVAGPRANYYIDLSSADTSNIAAYIDAPTGEVKIPLYYSSIPVSSGGDNTEWYLTSEKTFNWYDGTSGSYLAGLYPAISYGSTSSSPVGAETVSVYQPDHNYGFWADFSHVERAYDEQNLWMNQVQSDSANIWIYADYNNLDNSHKSVYGNESSADYNFFVRTKSETENTLEIQKDGWAWNHYDTRLRLVEDMEYGIYVTDKTYLRDYYNQVMEDKLAQNYTYYSWETFRDATRLIEDYLNNYMQLADMYNDADGKGYSVEQDYAADHAKYDEWVTENAGGSLQTVLTNEDVFEAMLSAFPEETQNVLCYLLTKAENQLFEYSTFQDFKNAYSEYTRRENQMGNYTVSSWAQYLQYADNIKIEGTDITLAALNEYLPESNDSKTDVDAGEIYDPNKYGTDGYPGDDLNCSWKIIYDGYFGGNAKEVFEKATEAIQQATNLLRTKATYKNLNEAMDDTVVYTDSRQTMNGHDGLGNAENAGITGVTGKDVFSIDRSTVSALAETMNQGSSYYTNDSGSYTVSSVAALDKILSNVFKVKASEIPYKQGSYEDFVSEEEAYNEYTVGDPETEPYYYSKLVRDDQQRFADVETGNAQAGQNTDKNSVVQDEIDRQARLVNAVLNQMQTLADPSEYETFDYLIDVISTIDFNAYTPEGQELLWNKLSELLVEGGVYSVNQQIFAENADESTSELEQALFDGDKHYYTGLNAGDVDTATTELMTLLTELDETQRKTYTVNFTVQYMNTDGTENNSVSQPYTKSYNTPLDLSIEGYDPNSMYAYSWVVKTYTDDGNNTETVSNLRNIGSTYTYNSNNNADITVYVTRGMADPSTDNDVNIVPVVVTTRLNQRNEVAMNLSEADLGNYSVNVNDDTLSVYNTPDASGEPFAVVTANQLPYHTFNGWRINYKVLGDGTYTLAQLYDAEDGYITISNSYTLEDFTNLVTVNGKNYAGDSAADGYVQFDGYVAIDTATYGADMPGKFYAWLITGTGADTELKIAAYTEKYSCNVPNGGYDFVQVNSDEVDGETVYYIYDAEQGYRQLSSDSQMVDKGNIQELDTNSLYYRLDNHLRDSWSSISEYDATSSKVSLYSHFTAAEDVPEAATVVESGCVAMYVSTGTDAAELNESLQIKGEGVNKFVASSFTSVTSEGQYMMSISFPSAVADTGYAVAMRSFVTYSYMGVNEKGEYGQIYRTVYSDVKLADLTTTAE